MVRARGQAAWPGCGLAVPGGGLPSPGGTRVTWQPSRAAFYRQAVEFYADLGYRYQIAETLNYAGDAHQADGDLPAARHAWTLAVGILDGLRHPDAGQVRAKLDLLANAGVTSADMHHQQTST